MKKKVNYVTKRNRIIKRVSKAIKISVLGKYGYLPGDEVDDEYIKEVLVAIFYMILKLNILNFATIYFIYLQMMKLKMKERINALLKIYVHLRYQMMYFEGIITKRELNSVFPENERYWIYCKDNAYRVYFDFSFIGKEYDENEVIDEKFFYALCDFAYYVQFCNENNAYPWYLELIDCNVDDFSEQMKNLIVRFKIEELRRDGILTRYDEALFMRKLPENDLTYQFYDYDTVLKWKWYPYKDMFEYIRAKKGGQI